MQLITLTLSLFIDLDNHVNQLNIVICYVINGIACILNRAENRLPGGCSCVSILIKLKKILTFCKGL